MMRRFRTRGSRPACGAFPIWFRIGPMLPAPRCHVARGIGGNTNGTAAASWRSVGPPMPGEGAEEFARQHSLDNVGSDGLRTT